MQQMAPQAAASGANNAGNPVFSAVAQQQQAAAQQPNAPQVANEAARDAQGRFVARNESTAMASAQPTEAAGAQQAPAQQAEQPPAQPMEQPQAEAPQQEEALPAAPSAPPVVPAAQATKPEAAMTDAEQQAEIANAMQKAQETILAQQQAQEQAAKQHADQMKLIQEQLQAQQKQMAELQKMKDDNEAQLEKVRQEQQAQATANKQRMLAQLNATLNTIGKSQPGQSVVLPQPPEGAAAMDITKQSEYEAKLMDTTINTMQALQQQSNTANMEAQTNKRTASDALAAGYNFHTGSINAPAMQMGTVNCSRDADKHQHRDKRMTMDPSKDKETVLGEQIREWYATQKSNNAKIDFTDCSRQFDSMRRQLEASAVTGTVSASKDGMWSANNLVEGNAPVSALCMQQMQPQLFSAISDLNPGRIIGPEETRALMNTIQVAPSMPQR